MVSPDFNTKIGSESCSTANFLTRSTTMPRALLAVFSGVLLAVFACSPQIEQRPVTIAADRPPDAPVTFLLTANAELKSSAGYTSTVASGTTWDYLGSIPQGLIYKPRDALLTAEGAHVSEAYMVVRDGKIVGFYLPVQGAFSPLNRPAILENKPI